MARKEYVYVRRQWNDWRIAEVELIKIEGLKWSYFSGGVYARSPQPFVHGYVLCTDIIGDIAHSCLHGEGSHRIKICIVRKDNSSKIWQKILKIVGSKPI